MPNTINLHDKKVEYNVVESNRATQPRIDVDIREIKVVIPEELDIDPDELVKKNATWILKKKQKYDRHLERAPNRKFEEGATLPFLGEEKTIKIESVEKPHMNGGGIILPKEKLEESTVQKEIESLYRSEARSIFQDRANHYAKKMDVDFNTIYIWNQRTRWASCSPKENLSFNWRLVMASMDIIDYVIVHELAHLKEKNHTKRFWEIIGSYISAHKKKANWLEENSAKLIFTEEDL